MGWKGIVAVDDRNGIGRDGGLPWYHKEDLAQFRRKTTGGIVVMGGRTFRSIGRPLPNRANVVLSRTVGPIAGNAAPGVGRSVFTKSYVARDKQEVEAIVASLCAETSPSRPVWVVGGAQMYELFHDKIDAWHVTRVKGEYDCDRGMPPYWLDRARYREDSCEVLDDAASVSVYSSK